MWIQDISFKERLPEFESSWNIRGFTDFSVADTGT